MAQPPRRSPPPQRRPPPLPEDPPDFRDPSEGLSPAVVGSRELSTGEEQQYEYPPPEPVYTIADEQRERSAYIESIGVEAYKAENDGRTEEEKVGSFPVEGVNVVAKGGGAFPPRYENER
jgi:hypothetical protein